tara:strand:- start:382 stop:768 length:387 start_codon:yes stop_codon:yes gene_type:complete
MPHLQFDVNKKLSSKQREVFSDFIKNKFSKIMKTGTNHIAISIRELPKKSLALGRAGKNDCVCFMNLDIRDGRSLKQKRELVKEYMKGVKKILGISLRNQYVTFTSHPGNEFNLFEGPLKKWTKNDDP